MTSMAINRGKQWELKLKEDWGKLPNSFIIRLPDQITGYKTTSQNPCDYIGFANRKLFLLECKSTHGTTLNFSNMKQYERLLEYKNIPYIYPGIMVWFNDYDVVYFAPITVLEKMKKDKLKSINVSKLNLDKYPLIKINTTKKRVFLECDFTDFIKLGD